MRRQRGVAAITAILVVAVAATAATMMLARQSAMIDQAAMVAARAQADLHAHAGLDWARGVLAEDARRAGDVDFLAEGWAQPIAALPVERAIVSGAIEDEQGKLNLNNLVAGAAPSAPDVQLFKALLAGLGLPAELADAVVDWIDDDADLAGPGGAEDAYYLGLARPYRAANRAMSQVEELHRVRGFDAEAIERLAPYVTALPGRTAINVNTAHPALLAAATGLAAAQLAPLAAERRAKPFRSPQAFQDRIAALGAAAPPAVQLAVQSAHFRVRVAVVQDDVQLAAEALVRRTQGGTVALVWRRPVY